MNKVRITLALIVMLAVGGLIVGTNGNAAKADHDPKNEASSAALSEDLPIGISPWSAGNLFDELQNPLLAYMTGATTRTNNSNEENGLLNQINGSGIRALINVKMIGSTNQVTGFAGGMDPYKAYVSLFYDAKSPGNGPCACIPSNPPPPSLQNTCRTTNAPKVNFSQMVIGYWVPLIGSTTRNLLVIKAGDPNAPVPLAAVPLANIGSVSVREDTQLGQPLPAAPDPARFQLRACGKLRPDQ
jgi:hypothetical protein